MPQQIECSKFGMQKTKKRLKGIKNPLKPSRFRGFLVGVARLKLAASASQMRRAINCATPR